MTKTHSKYGAKITVVDGIKFHSKREAAVYAELKILEKAGKIADLKRQPKFPFVIDGKEVRYRDTKRKLSYVADFLFVENGKTRIIDVKGFDTKDGRVKRTVAEAIYNIEVEIWK